MKILYENVHLFELSLVVHGFTTKRLEVPSNHVPNLDITPAWVLNNCDPTAGLYSEKRSWFDGNHFSAHLSKNLLVSVHVYHTSPYGYFVLSSMMAISSGVKSKAA